MLKADMGLVHPRQIERACSKCGAVCGVYPSGQKVLASHPKTPVVCVPCAAGRHQGKTAMAAAPLEELIKEARESVRATRQ
jgi:hypothetical protein